MVQKGHFVLKHLYLFQLMFPVLWFQCQWCCLILVSRIVFGARVSDDSMLLAAICSLLSALILSSTGEVALLVSVKSVAEGSTSSWALPAFSNTYFCSISPLGTHISEDIKKIEKTSTFISSSWILALFSKRS